MTVRDFRLPDLGEGLESAEIVRWLVAAGDVVTHDQPLVEVVTAKASVELPSPFAGTVTALHHPDGAVVAVGEPLLSVDEPAGAATPPPAAPPAPPAGEPSGDGTSGSVLVGYGTRPQRARRRGRRGEAPALAGSAAAAATTAPPTPPAPLPPLPAAGSPDAPPAGSHRVVPVVSPVVRRLARDNGVDLARLAGSGPNGLIKRADVEAALAERSPSAPAAAARTASVSVSAQRVPISGLHRQMAEQVTRSRREIPEATVWVDVDATGLLRARDAWKSASPTGQSIALVTLVARFCLRGLQRWPLLNGRVEGDEVVVDEHVGLGFAAQTERGLVVPVVHGAEAMSLAELDGEVRRLSAAARDGSLAPADVTGGTFTVNNYGVFGVDGSAAIINHPQVAMIGVGRVVERPWVVAGEIAVRPVTELTLVFDHRACDGGVAGGFLRFVADCVEQPVLAL